MSLVLQSRKTYVVLNERRRIKSTCEICIPTLRTVCRTFLRCDILALKQTKSFIPSLPLSFRRLFSWKIDNTAS